MSCTDISARHAYFCCIVVHTKPFFDFLQTRMQYPSEISLLCKQILLSQPFGINHHFSYVGRNAHLISEQGQLEDSSLKMDWMVAKIHFHPRKGVTEEYRLFEGYCKLQFQLRQNMFWKPTLSIGYKAPSEISAILTQTLSNFVKSQSKPLSLIIKTQ